MRAFNVLLCCCSIVLIVARPVAAHEAQQGETCGEVKHSVARTINKQNYSCDATTCTKCDAGGSAISNCTSTTYYENCVAAANIQRQPRPITGGVLQPPSSPPKTVTPPGVQSPTGPLQSR